MKRFLSVILLICSLLTARAADCDTVISLVNVYAGGDIYQLEGHTALRISVPNRGLDVAVGWGTFDFASPGFVYRFVKGETDYTISAIPWEYFLYGYKYQNRRVVSHRLNLNSEQKTRLIGLIDDNLKPENRIYRYNYVKDNCATRPMSMVEKAVGDTIAYEPLEEKISYRDVMRQCHANYPWYQFGIDLVLGEGIDYPLTSREIIFAPVVLDKQITAATIGGKPVVLDTEIVNDVPEAGAICEPTPWYLTPMCFSCVVLALAIWCSIRDIRRGKINKVAHAIFFSGIALVGMLLTFLIFVSVHEATSPNWLYVWCNPLSLIVPTLIWIKKCRKVVKSYYFANFVALLALCIIWAALPQHTDPAVFVLIAADLGLSFSYLYVNKAIYVK